MQNNRKKKLVKNNKYKRINSINLKRELKKKCIKVLLPIGIVGVVATSINLNIDKSIKDKKDDISISTNNEKTKQNEYLKLIVKYCEIYNLDSILIYKKVIELTNGFENIENNGLFYIPGTRVCNIEQKFDNLELAVLCFVRHCKQKPEDFNLNSEQLKFKKNYDVDELMPSAGVTDVINDYYFNTMIDLNDIFPTAGITTTLNDYLNSFNSEDKVDNYCNLLSKLPKELCMAIIYSECGIDENGNIVVHNNNPGNLRADGEFRNFENVEQGIIELALTLEYNFLKDIDMENTPINIVVEKIKERYAPDSDTAYGVNKNWSNNVIKIYNELKEDYYSRLDKRTSPNKKI